MFLKYLIDHRKRTSILFLEDHRGALTWFIRQKVKKKKKKKK